MFGFVRLLFFVCFCGCVFGNRCEKLCLVVEWVMEKEGEREEEK